MKNKNLTSVVNYVLAVLMFAYVVLTFLPYVTYSTYSGDAVTSIQNYIWMVPDGINDYIQQQQGGFYDINAAVLGPIICSLCSLIGAVICLVFSKKGASAILPLIAGIVGIIDYFTNPFVMLGNIWLVHLLIFIIITILAAINAVIFYKRYQIKKKTEIL